MIMSVAGVVALITLITIGRVHGAATLVTFIISVRHMGSLDKLNCTPLPSGAAVIDLSVTTAHFDKGLWRQIKDHPLRCGLPPTGIMYKESTCR